MFLWELKYLIQNFNQKPKEESLYGCICVYNEMGELRYVKHAP